LACSGRVFPATALARSGAEGDLRRLPYETIERALCPFDEWFRDIPPASIHRCARLERQFLMSEIVTLEHVTKEHGAGGSVSHALVDVSFAMPCGEFACVMGPSGCGKTTLLNLVACLDVPNSGRVSVAGRDLAGLSDQEKSAIRLRDVGFIFQSFNLLPRLSVEKNVSWRLRRAGASRREARDGARAALEKVRVPPAAWLRYPSEISGGEQQRVAAARALATSPKLLLADEPTGNLDSASGQRILNLLKTLNVDEGMSILLVTHDRYASSYGNRTIEMRDGRIVWDGVGAPPPRDRGQVLPFDREGGGKGPN
jgi:putative ABC transport system ATP-binding protein